MHKNKKQLKGVVAKIRKFRNDVYEKYMKRHNNKFDIHQFTAEFLNKPAVPKTA
ncbi:MAG: hypothetical protein ABIG90_01510 [bacterium]